LLLSYLGLSDFENKEVNLNKALIANREAVSVFEEGNLVFDKSIALAAGANIYLKYSEVNNTVKNLTEAKRTVESALTYFKKENYPYQYAI